MRLGSSLAAASLLVLVSACTGPRIRTAIEQTPIALAVPLPRATLTFEPTSGPAPAVTESPLPPPTETALTLSFEDGARPEALQILPGPGGAVSSLAFSPNGAWLAAGTAGGAIRIWRLPAAQLEADLIGHSDDIRDLSFSPAGDRLASASVDGTVNLWTFPAGVLDSTIDGLLERVFRVSFSPDGELLALAGNRCLVEIRDARHGILRQSLIRPGCSDRDGWATAWGLDFSPDGARLALGEGRPCCAGRLYLWQLGAASQARELPHDGPPIGELAFSPDGSLLAVASNLAAIRVWNVADGTLHTILESHRYAVHSLAFSADGRWLASGSRDLSIRIWDFADGRVLAILESHAGSVNALAFSPDGSLLASGSEDGTVILWGMRGRG